MAATLSESATTPVATVADAIESTLEWLDRQGGKQINTGERRLTRRRRYRVAATISFVPPGQNKYQSFEVRTRNLSRTGLSFLHKTLIYPRQSIRIHLPLPDQSVRLFGATVVRVRSAGHGLFEIGAEFTDIEVAIT